MRMTPRRYRHHSQSTQHSWLRRRVPLAVLLVVLPLATWGIIAYMNTQQQNQAVKLLADQKVAFARIDAQVKATLQKRIDDARKAEAEARATAAEEAAKRAAMTKPSVPLAITADGTNCGVANPGAIQVVINKKHCFSPLDYAPSDLVSLADVTLRSEAATQYAAMQNAAIAAGQGFAASSSYRSYQTQIATYNYWVGISGSVQADTYSARPGYSEHQTGLVVDVKAGGCALDCFGGSTQYGWLQQHAHEYGFVERYPAGLTSITGYTPEPWHWRYVGAATANDMKTKGIQTLEQYFRIEGGDYAG